MKNSLFSYAASETARIKTERATLIAGGLVALVLGVLQWLMFSGNEYVWWCYMIPRAMPPRGVVLILGMVWYFILGAAFSFMMCSVTVGRERRRKCLIDIGITLIFLYLWYPLFFAAASPFLALVALVGAAMFTVFALIVSYDCSFIVFAVSAISLVRCLFYIYCTVSFMITNCLLF